MKYYLSVVLSMGITIFCVAQPSYFPPTSGGQWETTSPATYNWCQPRIDSLYNFLESNNSKAFILLRDGKIVLEQYFNGHGQFLPWYWASAGKTLTAFVTGIAQQEGFLDINEPTQNYLGSGWTNCTPQQESAITIWHQLTMTSGLDDGVADPFCFDPQCLQYLAEPGSRWAYHNGPYTLLDQVIASATSQTLNDYTTQKVKTPTGMTGSFFMSGNNNVFWSNARSMARFGLLIQNNGNWDGNQIMTDQGYFNNMVNTSQNLNESYGYLWWLNGKPSFMLPGIQLQIPGSVSPAAPDDCLMALGMNGQFINVSQSQNMVWIRMGESPDNLPVPYLLNDLIWEHINQLECTITSTAESAKRRPVLYPNPVGDRLNVNNARGSVPSLTNASGVVIASGADIHEHNFSGLQPGLYIVRLEIDGQITHHHIVKD